MGVALFIMTMVLWSNREIFMAQGKMPYFSGLISRKQRKANAGQNSTKGGNHGKLSFWPVDAWAGDLNGSKTRSIRETFDKTEGIVI